MELGCWSPSLVTPWTARAPHFSWPNSTLPTCYSRCQGAKVAKEKGFGVDIFHVRGKRQRTAERQFFLMVHGMDLSSAMLEGKLFPAGFADGGGNLFWHCPHSR